LVLCVQLFEKPIEMKEVEKINKLVFIVIIRIRIHLTENSRIKWYKCEKYWTFLFG